MIRASLTVLTSFGLETCFSRLSAAELRLCQGLRSPAFHPMADPAAGAEVALVPLGISSNGILRSDGVVQYFTFLQQNVAQGTDLNAVVVEGTGKCYSKL